MRNRVIALLVPLFLAASIPVYGEDAPEVGEVVKDLTLKTPDGKSAKLSDYRSDKEGKGGNLVVLTFWSYKCPTGRRMMDANREIAKFCKENDVVFLGVSAYGESEADVKKYVADEKISYTITYDGDHSITKGLGVQVVSTTLILDREGKLVYHGAMVSREMDKKTGKKAPHALDAVKELVAGKEVSTPKTLTYG